MLPEVLAAAVISGLVTVCCQFFLTLHLRLRIAACERLVDEFEDRLTHEQKRRAGLKAERPAPLLSTLDQALIQAHTSAAPGPSRRPPWWKELTDGSKPT